MEKRTQTSCSAILQDLNIQLEDIHEHGVDIKLWSISVSFIERKQSSINQQECQNRLNSIIAPTRKQQIAQKRNVVCQTLKFCSAVHRYLHLQCFLCSMLLSFKESSLSYYHKWLIAATYRKIWKPKCMAETTPTKHLIDHKTLLMPVKKELWRLAWNHSIKSKSR